MPLGSGVSHRTAERDRKTRGENKSWGGGLEAVSHRWSEPSSKRQIKWSQTCRRRRREKESPTHTKRGWHFWLIEALLHQVHSAETGREREREGLPTGAMCCQKIQHFGHCCEEKTPCGDIVWVAGRTGRLPQIITSEINLMCGIQSVVIGTAAALERSSKCYLLIHGMRTDTQPQRIDCAISSLCAVLTQWKGEMRFNVVMHGSLWLLRSSQDSRPVLQVRISWDIRRRNISTEGMHRGLAGERVINNLKIFHSDCVIFLEGFILMWCYSHTVRRNTRFKDKGALFE